MKVAFSFCRGKRLLILVGLLSLVVPVSAQVTFQDNFNRSPGPVGDDWLNFTTEEWRIALNGIEAVSGGGITGMVHTGLTLSDKPFLVQADFWSGEARWYGLIFHADPLNPSSHWLFRIQSGTSAVQLLRFTNGVVAQNAINTTISPALTTTGDYQLQVIAPASGNVELRLFDGNTGSQLWFGSHNITAGIPEGGGLAGLYAANSTVRADNFYMEVIPEPATVGMVLGLAALFGVFGYRRLRSKPRN